MQGVWLEDLTWPEAKAWFDRDAVVLVPIGAASKEHGHALPLCTDYLLARGITDRVLAELPIVAAPVLSLGYYPAFRHYPGSQTISPQTFYAVLDEVLSRFVDQGVKNLAIYNTGISTEQTVTLVAREFYERTGVRVAVAHIARLGRSSDHVMEQKLGGHGDEHETSIIMAMYEDRVRKDKLATDYGHMLEQPKSVFYIPSVFSGEPASGRDYTATGIRGDARLASKEKGEVMVTAIVADIVDGLRVHFPEALARAGA